MHYKHEKLPFFVVDFAAARWDHITWEFQGTKFFSSEVFFPGVTSIHLKSSKDSLFQFLHCDLNFEKPDVISHKDGHRPVKILEKDDLERLA